MQEFIVAQRQEIAELCRRHHVRRMAVFGSAARDDFDPSTSDIDLIVEFDEMPIEQYADNKWALEEELANRFSRKIDLLTWSSIQNPYFLGAIQRSCQPVYGD